MSLPERVVAWLFVTVFAGVLLGQIVNMNGYLRQIAESLAKISGMNF